MVDNALYYRSATALARLIRERQVTSEDVVEAHLRRIEAVNPRLNAVVQLTAETARAQAQAADRAVAEGRSLGPLHGVPFTVKDIFDVAGVISAAGLVERRDFIPKQDAVTVRRLKMAGAILLGKTNCPAGGGGGESDNPVYGRTNNPYNPTRTPGGSSGGEAAIIAVGGSPLGLGSDSGGSLRLPAHYCGIATLRPTVGRVPNTGVIFHPGGLRDPRSQIGPLARHVEDLALAFSLLVGMDWRDSGVVPMPRLDPAKVKLSDLRLAVYTDDGIVSPTPETAAAVRRVADALASVGLYVEEARLPRVETTFDISRRYWRQAAAELNGPENERLMDDWDEFRTAALTFMESRDAILCPVSWAPAVMHGRVRHEEFSYTLPFSLTGWPGVTVRAGTSPEGLPIGVQITARPWREDVALAVARQVETMIGHWPPVGD